MKHVFLVLLLVFGLAHADEQLSAEQQAVQMMSDWQAGFYQYLLQHKDPELRAYGAFFLAKQAFPGNLTCSAPWLASSWPTTPKTSTNPSLRIGVWMKV